MGARGGVGALAVGGSQVMGGHHTPCEPIWPYAFACGRNKVRLRCVAPYWPSASVAFDCRVGRRPKLRAATRVKESKKLFEKQRLSAKKSMNGCRQCSETFMLHAMIKNAACFAVLPLLDPFQTASQLYKQEIKMSKYYGALLTAALFLVSLTTNSLHWLTAPPGINGDAAKLGLYAHDLLQEKLFPFYVYHQFAPHPLIIYVQSLVFAVLGYSNHNSTRRHNRGGSLSHTGHILGFSPALRWARGLLQLTERG